MALWSSAACIFLGIRPLELCPRSLGAIRASFEGTFGQCLPALCLHCEVKAPFFLWGLSILIHQYLQLKMGPATRTSRKGYIQLPTRLLLYYMAYLAIVQVLSKMGFQLSHLDLFRPWRFLYPDTSVWRLPSRRPLRNCLWSRIYSKIWCHDV